VAGVQAQGFSDLTFGVRQVASREKPAVVQITNQQVTLDRFTGSAVQVPAGVGSGIIYDQQGHILTNNHVIAGADGLEVSLPDGRAFPAKLVGADPPTDLAVLQIQGDNLPTAPLGDSGQLAVGDWVVAIGNALGLPGGPTVTVGVVSALGRTVQEPADQPSSPGLGPAAQRAPAAGAFLFDAIQTDAAINPGNSGGPLININGEVVGINTLVAAQAEPGVPAQGIGFAIAIASAKPIADQLVANGRVAHAYLGIGFAPLSPAIAAQLGVPSDAKGVAVAQVAPGSPAASAGVQPRDVITAIDGQPLTDESSLPKALAAHKPGDRVQVTINRRGQTQDVQVTLGEAPA
jgi:S1-C subfamily serine protease